MGKGEIENTGPMVGGGRGGGVGGGGGGREGGRTGGGSQTVAMLKGGGREGGREGGEDCAAVQSAPVLAQRHSIFLQRYNFSNDINIVTSNWGNIAYPGTDF